MSIEMYSTCSREQELFPELPVLFFIPLFVLNAALPFCHTLEIHVYIINLNTFMENVSIYAVVITS
jgi:hypothetical protein